jgi:hypothetical protein
MRHAIFQKILTIFSHATRSLKGETGGGPDRDRTDDLVIANDALSQLSYRPVTMRGRIHSQFHCLDASGK